MGFYPNWKSPELYKTLRYDALTTIGYFGVKALVDGSLGKEDYQPQNLIQMAHSKGVKVVLVLIQEWASSAIDQILASPTVQDTLVENLFKEVTALGFDGVDIDLEGMPTANRVTGAPNRELYTQFITKLSQKFWGANPKYRLSIDLPAVDWNETFDIPKLQNLVTYMMIMGYDYHWSSAPTAGAISPLTSPNGISVTDSINKYLTLMSKDKLLLGVPHYGYEWSAVSQAHDAQTNGGGMTIEYKDAIVNAARYGEKWDDVWSSPYYLNGNNQGWFDNVRSLGLKYDLVNQKGLAGIGVWALGYDGGKPEVFDLIVGKFGSAPIPEPTPTPTPTPEPTPEPADADTVCDIIKSLIGKQTVIVVVIPINQ